MKFIAHHLNLIGLVLLASFIAAAAGLYFQAPERAKAPQPKAAAAAARFVCPMHPNVTRATQTGCPECGMKLVALGRERAEANAAREGGCCGEKPFAAKLPTAMVCPHLAAQAAQASSCCPKSANP